MYCNISAFVPVKKLNWTSYRMDEYRSGRCGLPERSTASLACLPARARRLRPSTRSMRPPRLAGPGRNEAVALIAKQEAVEVMGRREELVESSALGIGWIFVAGGIVVFREKPGRESFACERIAQSPMVPDPNDPA